MDLLTIAAQILLSAFFRASGLVSRGSLAIVVASASNSPLGIKMVAESLKPIGGVSPSHFALVMCHKVSMAASPACFHAAYGNPSGPEAVMRQCSVEKAEFVQHPRRSVLLKETSPRFLQI